MFDLKWIAAHLMLSEFYMLKITKLKGDGGHGMYCIICNTHNSLHVVEISRKITNIIVVVR